MEYLVQTSRTTTTTEPSKQEEEGEGERDEYGLKHSSSATTTSSSTKEFKIDYSDLIDGYLNGYTAFHQACDIGDLEIVKCLCRAGVDRQLLDRTDGLSGIELAREAGRKKWSSSLRTFEIIENVEACLFYRSPINPSKTISFKHILSSHR
ncbi:hypothetical protein H4Q26_014488 [Puccinia striiformis f. sp. tritici PST-130]|nr:hypothetical protein H4Q26_014488 [Puccinia striiformis f. sp. tritici PST-130]